MNVRYLSTYALVAVVSATGGAWLTAPEPTPADVEALAAVPHPPAVVAVSSSQQSEPLISVSSYGTVTLRVEQEPLEWVLEQIEKQSGWADVKERAGAGRRSVAAAAVPDPKLAGCATANAGVLPAATTVLQAIATGSDDERYDSLLQAARSDLASLTDNTLKRLYETDASDRVRALAFQRLLERRTESIDEMRAALEAGLAVPNEAVQAEARRRLDSLLDGEGSDTNMQ